MSKKEHLWNNEKYFLFYFESSFCSWANQILNFEIFKCHGIITCLSIKHETHFSKLGKQTHSCYEIWRIYLTLQNKTFYQKIIWKKVAWKLSHLPIEVVLNSLQTQKSLELVFSLQFWQNFLMKLFGLECDINVPKFHLETVFTSQFIQ